MPFKSKAQARFFRAAAAGKIKDLTKATAKKFIEDTNHQTLKDLPEKVKFKSLKLKLKR